MAASYQTVTDVSMCYSSQLPDTDVSRCYSS